MKKLLMCSAAVAGLAAATPAKADGIKLDLAGHFKGYVTWVDESITGITTNERHFDILRETEIHFTGETTLDNGLTVGVHHEALIDSPSADGFHGSGQDVFITRESYAYFSGAWGRVNFGKEDGANYLLQVAAPSGDTNYDGLRQSINPEGLGVFGLGGVLATGGIGAGQGSGAGAGGGVRGFVNTGGKLDYSDDASGFNNKITYLTPVWSGFQAGASYTPSVNGFLQPGGIPGNDASTAFGVPLKDGAGNFGDAWEGALRYEGKWQELGLTLGGGYTHVQYTAVDATDQNDAFHQWNLGAALTWQQLGLGVVYTTDNGALRHDGQNRTWVAGVDWTTGPFKLGASYLNNHEGLGDTTVSSGVSNGQLDTTRWAPGVIYTYGPGMTFRGSVGWVHTSLPNEGGNAGIGGHANSSDVLLGTQINF
jgi:outer membrane protein OmpU